MADDIDQLSGATQRLRESLEEAFAAQHRTAESMSRVASSALAEQLEAISASAMTYQMNQVIEGTGFKRVAASMQSLVSQNAVVTDAIIRNAGLGWATQIQEELAAVSAASRALVVNSRVAETALRAAGLSETVSRAVTPLFEGRMSTVLDRFTRQYSDLARQIQEQADRNVRFSDLMMELGWPPPIDLRASLVDEILQVSEDEGLLEAESRIEEALVRHFDTRRLRAKTRGWSGRKLLQRRATILAKAVEAHIKGDYELSVPALISQIEGVIADGFNHVGQMNGAQYQKYIDSHFEAGRSGMVIDEVNRAIRQFAVRILLARFEHGSPPESPLSRHAILHGADTDYATVKNSLKAILMVDALQDSFGVVTLEGSVVFHLQGCPAVLNSTSPALHYRDSELLLAAGKRPCKRCMPW